MTIGGAGDGGQTSAGASAQALGVPPAVVTVVAIGLLLALVVVAVVLVPWSMPAPPPGGATAVDPARDFTAAQMAREDAFHAALRPWAYASLGLGLAVACLLGFTRLGGAVVTLVSRPVGGNWFVGATVGAVLAVLIARVATIPLDVRSEQVLREYGLSVRTWSQWSLDRLKSALVVAVVAAVVVVVVVGLARASPRLWWAFGAGVAAALVVVGSLVWPLLVEPLFLTATPLPAGELRTSILALAEQDGVPLDDVLVADASRRTTALNAYVSGIGPTRRLVLYDTLVNTAPASEVRLVAAHELGHAARSDVWRGTVIGALGAALGVVLLALLVRSGSVLTERAGATGPGDPRVAALLVALVAVASFLVSPVENLMSRRVEATADRHALDLTRDPTTAADMHRRLAVQNLSDLDPPTIVYAWFASHPTAPQRIAAARDWAATNGVPPP